MSRLARTDTAPELALRRELHSRGLRYRVQLHVPGNRRRRIDIAFTRARVAVLVDGCYWHGCPEHGTRPRTNREWWDWKIQRNRDRDTDTNRLLDEAGWTVVRVWEHEDPAAAADRIEQLVRPTV
ncbi:very short patch repair endonuclease [Aeromicrobium sp.]|uniref:very short patch repair endonuclease n=1 Tax=Aeromicrobium sp. TaxID=1871063 RepID=UPI0040340CBC